LWGARMRTTSSAAVMTFHLLGGLNLCLIVRRAQLLSSTETLRTTLINRSRIAHHFNGDDKMKRTILSAVAVLLIAGSMAQVTPAFARHDAPASSRTFRNALDSDNGTAHWCSTEPGNPYNPATDYQTWSAWRAIGAWDSRNDCR
jgi:hypothetical protein